MNTSRRIMQAAIQPSQRSSFERQNIPLLHCSNASKKQSNILEETRELGAAAQPRLFTCGKRQGQREQ